MIHLPITSFYTMLAIAGLIILTVKVIKLRRKRQVLLHDGGDVDLKAAIRAHGNFVEYTPFFLILLALLELQAMPHFLLHLFAIAFAYGRISHAYSVAHVEIKPGKLVLRHRIAGMVITLTVLGLMALCLVFI